MTRIEKIKEFIYKIICFFWRYGNTHLSDHPRCTFCGSTNQTTMTARNRELHKVCDKCWKFYKMEGLKSSYWGGLGHK